ncbi:MAG: DUF447 domain-containing protein [Pirellulales bacterium]
MPNPLSKSPALPDGQRILESIVTTVNEDGTTHIAPMGPLIDNAFQKVLLRPYSTSTTLANLRRTRFGVMNITDDVELMARSAIGPLHPSPPLITTPDHKGILLANTCRWYSFEVKAIDDRQQRVQIAAQVIQQGRLRDFFGFNRAKHAVIEAAILATRLHLRPRKEIQIEFEHLAIIVQKTGGEQERNAFRFLQEHVESVESGLVE